MSAIYGELSKKIINVDGYNNRIKNYENYKFDRINHLKHKNIRFSCFIQHITPESIEEVLPFIDKENKCIITADIIIDNRTELLNMLEIKTSNISDSQIALKMYLKFGEEFCKYIVGDFAIAIFDEKEDKLILVRDQLGKRTLYYRKTDEGLIFSTLSKNLMKLKDTINEAYLRRQLAVKIIMNNYKLKETVFNDVFYVMPSHMIIYKNGLIYENCYWKLKKQKKIKDYKVGHAIFKEIFDEAVRCRLRANGSIGIMLSGGFDSAAVAAVASTLTKKPIKTFTSIPVKEYQLEDDNYYMFNEKKLVESVLKKHPNLEGSFFEFADINAFESTEYMVSILEQPWKAVTNGYWINGILREAKKSGCTVILDGQSGNYTISYSDFKKYLLSKLLTFKFITFNKALKNFCYTKRISRKKYLLFFFKSIFKFKNIDTKSLLNPYYKLSQEEITEYDTILSSMMKTYTPTVTTRKRIEEVLNPIYLNHIGEAETKVSLANGVIRRDPTRDIRLIQFLYNCSIDVFNHGGEDRALVSIALKDILPHEIISSQKVGYQSVDFIYRIKIYWEQIVKEIRADIDKEIGVQNYVDKEKLIIELNKYKELPVEFNEKVRTDIVNIMSVYSGIVFLKQIEEETNR